MSNLPIVATAPQASVAPTQAAAASENNNPQGQPFGDVLARQVQVADATTSSDKPSTKKTGAKTAEEIFIDIKVNADAALAPPAPSNLPADMLAALLPQNMVMATPAATPSETANNQAAVLLDATGVSSTTGASKRGMDTAQVTDAASQPKQATDTAQMAVATGASKQATDVAQAEIATQATVAAGVSKQIVDTTKSKPALVAASAPKQTALPTIEKPDLTVNQSSPVSAHAILAAQVDSKKDATFTAMLDKMTTAFADKLSANEEKFATSATAAQPNVAAQASVPATTPPIQASVMPVQITINTPVTQDKWGDEFNQKITWMATNKEQSAELHLNPPQLGPMDVVIKVSGDQATALFTSPHAAVRDAIEQALPKLREMMADNGIMLGNASVNDQAPRNGQDSSGNKAQRSTPGISGVADTASTGILSARVSPISRHNGIVDTFA